MKARTGLAPAWSALARLRTRIAPAQARALAAGRTWWGMAGDGVRRAQSWWRALPKPARQLASAALVAFLVAFGLVSWAILR